VTYKNHVYNEIMIAELLDPGKKLNKISCDLIKWYMGDQALGTGIQK